MARDEDDAIMRRLGVLAMEPRLPLAAMGQALDRDETSFVLTNVDWTRFGPWRAESLPDEVS
jgi:hypothetical protein